MTDNSNGARKMVSERNLNEFVYSYVESLMALETADDDIPLDTNFEGGDFSEEAWNKIVNDCRAFLEKGAEWITPENFLSDTQHTIWEQAGHDFYLTRQHHGAGFWDGDWTEEAGTALTELAATFPTFYPDFVEGQIVLI